MKLQWSNTEYNSSRARVGKLFSANVFWDTDYDSPTRESGYRWKLDNGVYSKKLHLNMDDAKLEAEAFIHRQLLVALQKFTKEG